MGAELGATTSLFPCDEKMGDYLRATKREGIAKLADNYSHCQNQMKVEVKPYLYYDEVIEIDLNELEPYIVGPHSPDKARPVSKLPRDVKKKIILQM